MAKDGGSYAGHGESSPKPSVSRGSFIGIGTYAQLPDKAYSPDKKNPIDQANAGKKVGS